MDCREEFDDSFLDQQPLSSLTEHKLGETVAWVGGVIAIVWLGVLAAFVPFALAAPPGNAELKVAVSDRVVDDKATGTPRITLDHQRNEYFLGENILIDYRLENTGPGPLRYEKGGFFPGLRRNDGYRVTAVPVDGVGKPIGPPAETFADPEESREGSLASWELAPGEAYLQTLYLPRYVKLEKAGRYSIRIANVDRLNPETQFSAGETLITLKEPAPTDARTIYQRMKRLPREPVAEIGESSKVPIADFQALLAPVYVPVLREHAMEGDRDALDGLGKMSTARANAALIEAVDRAAANDELDFALAAYHQVSGRPNPRFYPGFYPGFKADSPDCIAGRALVERVWRPEFVDPLRRLAARLARDPKPVGLAEIEEIYADVGTPDDMPNVMLGYTKAIELTRTLPPETHQYPRPRGAAYVYPIAVRMLLKRGAKAPTDPKTPGEIGASLVALRWQSDFRPADWAERLVRWLDHPIPYVRELVLEWVPEPVPPTLLDRLPRLLAGNGGDLQIAACRLAQKHPREAFRDPLLEILRQGRASKAEYLLEEYLLNAAVDAARANGIARDQLAEIWLSRIDPSDLGVAGIRRLLHTAIDYDGAEGSPGELSPKDTAAATTRWKRFIDEHRNELREGHRFKLGDPEITPDLFPPGFNFYAQGRPSQRDSNQAPGAPTPPFNTFFIPRLAAELRRTSLDVRILAAKNIITPLSKRRTNGQTQVLELPIRIENHSARTITANIAHEWFGGIWPPTDLGAAVRRMEHESRKWRASEVYLSGELGSQNKATVWKPGESHDLVLRVNWPGTGSRGAEPLIHADVPGKYAVRVSLVFKAKETSEYVVSPQMEIEVLEKPRAKAMNQSSAQDPP